MSKSNHMDGKVVQEFRDRIVALENERKAAAEEIKEICKAAETHGLNKRALRELVKRELETDEERSARERAEHALDEMEAALAFLGEEEADQRRAEDEAAPTEDAYEDCFGLHPRSVDTVPA